MIMESPTGNKTDWKVLLCDTCHSVQHTHTQIKQFYWYKITTPYVITNFGSILGSLFNTDLISAIWFYELLTWGLPLTYFKWVLVLFKCIQRVSAFIFDVYRTVDLVFLGQGMTLAYSSLYVPMKYADMNFSHNGNMEVCKT